MVRPNFDLEIYLEMPGTVLGDPYHTGCRIEGALRNYGTCGYIKESGGA